MLSSQLQRILFTQLELFVVKRQVDDQVRTYPVDCRLQQVGKPATRWSMFGLDDNRLCGCLGKQRPPETGLPSKQQYPHSHSVTLVWFR
jgi:hypothetical protein